MKCKKLLAIYGSPRSHGITAAMLDCAVQTAQKAGWTVDKIHLYDMQISYCTGCRACIHTGNCVQKDDIQEIAAMLKDCDVAALAAPVYWANVPAAVKNLFDRLLGTAMEETNTFPKPRLSSSQKYILLTACNTPAPFSWICGQSRGAIRAMDEFFKTSGMKCAGRFVCTNTGKHKKPPAAIIKRIERYWS